MLQNLSRNLQNPRFEGRRMLLSLCAFLRAQGKQSDPCTSLTCPNGSGAAEMSSPGLRTAVDSRAKATSTCVRALHRRDLRAGRARLQWLGQGMRQSEGGGRRPWSIPSTLNDRTEAPFV